MIKIILLTALFSGLASLGSEAYRKRRLEMTDEALKFLLSARNPDGSFGSSHRRFQTALAILALLSTGQRCEETQYGRVLESASNWLLKSVTVTGFAGDRELPTESHAVASLALSQLIGMMRTHKQNLKVYRTALLALSHTLSSQDKAYGGRYRGGWKPNPHTKLNDRKVSAWQLAFVSAMASSAKIPRSSLIRALSFMKGSFKQQEPHINKYDIGGFSFDPDGLPVRSISASAFFCLEYLKQPLRQRRLSAKWFENNPPVWLGPHFYYTHFFAVRALRLHALSTGDTTLFTEYFRRVTDILYEHQSADGSFDIPPGNAEYTKKMGKVYSTAMAVLTLNCDRNLLPLDMPVEVAPDTLKIGAVQEKTAPPQAQ